MNSHLYVCMANNLYIYIYTYTYDQQLFSSTDCVGRSELFYLSLTSKIIWTNGCITKKEAHDRRCCFNVIGASFDPIRLAFKLTSCFFGRYWTTRTTIMISWLTGCRNCNNIAFVWNSFMECEINIQIAMCFCFSQLSWSLFSILIWLFTQKHLVNNTQRRYNENLSSFIIADISVWRFVGRRIWINVMEI